MDQKKNLSNAFYKNDDDDDDIDRSPRYDLDRIQHHKNQLGCRDHLLYYNT